VQIDGESKIIFVHIPRTGGSWFSYAWNSDKGAGPIHLRANRLWYKNKFVDCGKHGQLSGILEKLQQINYDYTDHKILTLVRHPVDRALSSWVWFSEVKETAKKVLESCQYVMIELNSNTGKYGSSNQECMNFLESMGYKLLLEHWPDKVYYRAN
jgi:hypothetical protein